MNAYVHGLEEVCQSDRLKTEVSTWELKENIMHFKKEIPYTIYHEPF